jgi:hypothetical protein
MKERLAGTLLLSVVLPLAIFGYLLIVFYGLFGSTDRVRCAVRALDHFVNASVFNGYAWESLSSHAWRARDEKSWARFVIWVTNLIQQDHCQRANKREQPVVDLILQKRLHEKTVK